MASKSKFGRGFLFGVLTAAGAVAGSVYAFKKQVVEPSDAELDRVEENRKRANRKAHQAHQG
ncbi:DUF3042 family protein [Schleiferilactobacillus shenzhenensis]|uniref:DUF3042 family protein n=1 Tax=Schleiferilactobacillus shenzhenensis TaxID=1231337 RepID=UPI0003FCAB9A|nr:DUF3042 family protein [Schleiferilactobacillus shenzhenensis]